MKQKHLILALVLFAMLCLAGCWPFSEDGDGDYDIRGSWILTESNTRLETETGTIEFTGSRESGTAVAKAPSQPKGMIGTYQVQAKNVTVTFTTGMSDDQGGVMEGTFTDGNTMAGTWRDNTGRSGTWYATRTGN